MRPHCDAHKAHNRFLDAPFGDTRADLRYIVLVLDTLITQIDAYGPMTRAAAHSQAERVRADLEAYGLDGVVLAVVPLHEPLERW